MNDPRLHFRRPMLESPFHPRTSAANRLHAWGRWGGYVAALAYEDETMEYSAIRGQASLYDLSPMIKYRIAGADAEACLNRLTLRDVRKLAVGAVHYTAWVDDHGQMLDDGTLFRIEDTAFMLCCQERHLPWLIDSAYGFNVEITDATEDLAAVSLQGPCAYAVLRRAGFADAASLRPFRHRQFDFDGAALMISRTGFTGDLGYELWVEPGRALALWDRLMDAGAPLGLRPVGSSALDLARIEAGFIIANMDFVPADQAVRPDRSRSPFEVGLDWMVDFDKGHFNGRRALKAERDGGTSRFSLVGLDIDGNIPADHAIIYHDRRTEAGIVTAAAWSPSAKRNIALASLDRAFLSRADNLWVEIYALRELQYHKLMVRARIAPRPFFDPPRRRANPPGEN